MSSYSVSLQHTEPRGTAAVRERMPLRDVPARFRTYLDQVYAAARSGAIELDGQNIFVYHLDDALAGANCLVEFGVGARKPFTGIGRVEYCTVPGGTIVTTTHWGEYAELGAAHQAVVEWARANNNALSGTCWETYGHWNDDVTKRRTEVSYLLRA